VSVRAGLDIFDSLLNPFFLDMGPLEIPLSGGLELGVCVGAMSGGFALPCHR